jgi:serine-protein kinase ATM
MKHEATRKRMLGIRTYRILPLTPQTGVMEWVQNAVAFGNFLVDSKSGRGAHSRYYPNDYTNAECREKLVAATDKYQSFLEVCRNFHPAFRFFFIEKFPEASQWMRSRLSYTRSVATSSIVGWVLGIGDRHAQNILIDQMNAEVIHIDFGYVFEQGKYLGIPETVPFRLTRDVVDGFGVNGCEGTFRLCSEIVLEVLRENMSQVITILEVVIHDPLYKWSMSPVEVENRRRKRGSDGTEVFFPLKDGTTREKAGEFEENARQTKLRKDIANRTLMRIRNKLQGFDDSSFSSLSVEGFVQLLITEAQDPRNLCKVFAGWAPWL